MLATDVKQEELERDYQMERLRKICDEKSILIINEDMGKRHIIYQKRVQQLFIESIHRRKVVL